MSETERKGLTLRIVIAAFLGVLAALIIYHIPAWYARHEAEDAAERQEAVDSRLSEMKPMDFVARCGKLIEDKTVSFDGSAYRSVTVEMAMPDGAKKNVSADWDSYDASKLYDPSSWTLDSVNGLDGLGDRDAIEGLYPCTVKPGNDSDGLAFLTLDDVISQCGKPVQDKTADDGVTVSRYVTFEATGLDGGKRKVTAVFSGFGRTDRNFRLDYFGGLSVENDSSERIEKWYPCLKPAAVRAP